MKQRVWFERRFEPGVPSSAMPELVERLRGTPARLEERVRNVPPAVWVEAPAGRWSIQAHVGHLGDLEPLWAGRLGDLLAGAVELRPADLSNAKTHEARHDEAEMSELLAGFRGQRAALVTRLEALSEADLARTALHPRLRQPMTVTDLFDFVAEHDDHHLATIGHIAASR